jgi:8-oxo-dGTP pyrophosphatase MutT (NUDIX family)
MPARPLSPTWQELAKQSLLRAHYDLVVGEDFYQHVAQKAGQRDGEVALAIRRPDGHLLLHTKPSYPPGTWRIPTGGIEPGETIAEAVRRELAEETGLPANERRPLGIVTYALHAAGDRPLHGKKTGNRFSGVEDALAPGRPRERSSREEGRPTGFSLGISPNSSPLLRAERGSAPKSPTACRGEIHFASAVFLLTVPDLPPVPQDPHEQISGYRWIPMHDLPAIAAQLEHLPPAWADWGRFRALAHRFVAGLIATLW